MNDRSGGARRGFVVSLLWLLVATSVGACASPAGRPPIALPVARVEAPPVDNAQSVEREPLPGPEIAPERPKRLVTRRVLTNGLVVAQLADGPASTTVLTVGIAGLGTGSEDEHTGLARVAVQAWLVTAGFEAQIEGLGGRLTVAVEPDRTRLGLIVPTSATERALAALAKLMSKKNASASAFREVRAREAALFSLRAVDDDAFVSRQVLLRRVFQLPVSLHPYASFAATPSELGRLSLPAIQRFLRARISADATTIVVTGAAPPGLAAAFDATLGKLDGGPADLPSLTAPFPPDDTRILLIDRPGADGTTVQIGFAGLPRSSPAYPSVVLAAPLLELALRRDPRVPAATRVRLLHEIPRGVVPLVIELRTSAREAAATVAIVRAIVKQIATSAPTVSDLEEARRNVQRALPLGVRDPVGADELLDELAWARELDADDLRKALKSADPVGLPADLGPVLDCPEVIVAVGDASRVAKPLATLADVDVLTVGAGQELVRVRSLVHAPAAATPEAP